MRRFGKRMMNESRDSRHYSGDTFYIKKMELDTDEESLVESEDDSNNDSLHGFINDGDSVIDGIVDNWADYDEIDEEEAIEELRAKADYEREEDDGMRESVMRSRLRRGRMLRENRLRRSRMLRERRADGRNNNWKIRSLPVSRDDEGNIERSDKSLRYVGELTPSDGRNSFYRKALIFRDDDGNLYLQSYGTMVAKKTKDGTTYLLVDPVEDDWAFTQTTARHISSFKEI